MKNVINWCLALVVSYAVSSAAYAAPHVPDRIDENLRVILTGNTHPAANAENDVGVVKDSEKVQHIQILLKRTPEKQLAFETRLKDLQNPKSPHFHKWLTSEQLDREFGVDTADVQAVTAWLSHHGFEIKSTEGLIVDFSGTVKQIRETFHTEIHQIVVRGESHMANMKDPEIPIALGGVIEGVLSLNDFRPSPSGKVTAHAAGVHSADSAGFHSGYFFNILPADIQTIYDFNGFKLGPNGEMITGIGQTIAVIENSDMFDTNDWTVFRNNLGLSQFTHASLTTVNPGPTCTDPGDQSRDFETTLDVEWASAAAPNATIEIVSCNDISTPATITSYIPGHVLALEGLVNYKGTKTAPKPTVISASIEWCESGMGTTLMASVSSTYASLTAQGISVYVAAGDVGSGQDCYFTGTVWDGLGVNGLASTPNNVAVGGTEFNSRYTNSENKYWLDAGGVFTTFNTTDYRSALSYIPEITWNNTCADPLLAADQFSRFGFSGGFGDGSPMSLCNVPGPGVVACQSNNSCPPGYVVLGQQLVVDGILPSETSCNFNGGYFDGNCYNGSVFTYDWGTGSGGQSSFFKKPAYQLFSTPNDGSRDLPDLSLFATWGEESSTGAFISGHAYGVCMYSAYGCCDGAPADWCESGGGTSFGSPIMAGVQALVNQIYGAQGNPNPIIYVMGLEQYALPFPIGPPVFHDVKSGNNAIPCYAGTPNCFTPPGDSIGILSTSSTSLQPGYPATSKWDFATGFGSIDVKNFVQNPLWFLGALGNEPEPCGINPKK